MASVSSDLLWELTRNNSSYLVKRRESGGLQLSLDPLNASGKYSFSQSGFINSKAVGVVSTPEGNVQLLTKNAKATNKPAKAVNTTTFKQHKSARKIAAAVSKTAHGYRSDLAHDAIVKASALARTRKQKKTYASKPRR